MKQLTLFKFFILLLVFNPLTIQAEGTSSIAPSLADEAALFIGAGNTGGNGGDYGQFAWKGSSSKLYFNVQNSCEKVYMGFSDPINDRSFNLVNQNGGSGIERDLIFRILDPTGNPINNLSCFGNTTINGEVWQTLNEFTANIDNRLQADNGPNQLGTTYGYDAFVLDLSACGINITGNYAIEFYSKDANYNPNTAGAGFYIPFFDITVADCANQGMTGRVWSNNWGIGIKRDGDGSFDRAFNGSMYVCSTEGFITKIDFNTGINTRAEAGKNTDQRSGFRAGSFNISFNQRGPGTSGNVLTDRQSVQNANLTNPLLPVFLNLPDEAFCPVQEIGEIKAAANFLTGCPEDRCINVAATQPGQFEIIIEGPNGNGILDQPSERSLVYVITDADKVANPETPGYTYEACIPWDGKDGNGNTLLEVAVTITGNYFQGIYHFPVYDAEFNDDGFIVETVRPALGRQLLYYDDTNITELNNTTESKDGTGGCVGPCHRWTGEWEDYTNADDNFGNFNTINTWWFASTSAQDLTGELGSLNPLTINCPADYNGCTTASIDPSVTGAPAINFVNDNCAYTLDYTDVEIVNTCEGKTIERTWVAYFNNNPSDRKTCVQKITLVAPVLSNCPSDVVLSCTDNPTYSWQAPTIIGSCGGTVIQTSGPVSGSTFPIGTTTIAYEIASGCGATQSCSFTVTVTTTGSASALTITCPADYSGCFGESILPGTIGTATIKPNNAICDYELDYADAILENSCSERKIERTWSVYFVNNPSVRKTCTQTITLTAPALTNCPSDVLIGCNDSRVYSWQAPTVTGTCGGTVVQTSGPTSGSTFPEGTTTVTYQVADGCGETQTCGFTVTVQPAGSVDDLTLACPSDFTGCVDDTILPTVTGTATVKGTNTGVFDVADTNCPYIIDYADVILENNCSERKIERTWFVYFANNPSVRKTCTQTITLVAPTLTNCPSDVVIGCNDSRVYSWQAPTVAGTCGGTVVQTSGPTSGSAFPEGTTTITYQIGDGCGDTQTCSFMVTVQPAGSIDDLTLACPSDYTGCVDDTILPTVTGTATVKTANTGVFDVADTNCPYTLDYADVILENSCSERKIERTWSVYFVNNPSVRKTCTQTITLAAPALTNCPSDVVIGCNDSRVYSWQAPTVSGTCGGTVVQTSGPTSGSTFPEGTTTVTYQVADGCGETQTCSFTVTVQSSGSIDDLTLACPSDYTGCVDDTILPTVTGTATVKTANTGVFDVADNNCPYIIDYADVILENSCSERKIERTWSVYFVNNPSVRKTCAQTITLAAPTLTNCPSDVVIGCNDSRVYSWQAPTVLGTCGGTVVQTSGPASGSVFPTGTTTITYQVADGCGDVQTCSFTVTVNTGQISDLTIICPPNFASCTNQSTDPSSTGTATVTTTNSGCPYILEYSDILLEDGCASKTIQRTWYVYYTSNPSERKTCTQTITIDGLTLANCPTDTVLDCNEGNVYTWQPPTGVGSCGSCSDTVEIADFLYMGERGGHRYYCSRTKATWHDAKAIAESMNGYLVVLDDPAENAFCAGFLVNQFAHIGLTDEGTEGNFRWLNGAAVNYTNWYEDQPNNHENKQHYGQLVTEGKWNDSDGTEVLEYIVEVPCADIRQTSGPLNGSAFPNGTSTVTYEIGDGCGTTETCSFNVTVEGGLTIECSNDVILDCENSQNGASYSWTPPKASSCCDDCPSEGQDIAGFVYMGSYNGHQYYCSKEKESWAAAKATSEAAGGYLAVINDAGENQLLANFLTEQSAFIGLHDLNQEGQFEWLSGESMDYTNWYPGQPNNYQGRQDHVRLLQNGQWDDTYGHVKLEYIMEMPCMSIQQIEGPANGSVFPVGTTDVAYLIEDACGNQEICDFKVTVNPCDQVADYCGSGSNNTNFFWIRHVVCGNINQVSTSQGGYSDFTNQQTDMKAGSSQTIILSPGFGQNRYYVNWRVWIDYNRDGDFEDANEEVLTYKHYNILKLKFTVPQQCGVGPTRMRVAMKYFSPANSCESFTYGEVEDYTINLQSSGENLSSRIGSNRSNKEVEVEIIEHESTAPIKELTIGAATSLRVYPNPAREQLKVDLTDYSGVAGRLRIYNKLGQKVMEKAVGTDQQQHFSLAIDNLPNGLYLLSIESGNGEAIVQKFNKH